MWTESTGQSEAACCCLKAEFPRWGVASIGDVKDPSFDRPYLMGKNVSPPRITDSGVTRTRSLDQADRYAKNDCDDDVLDIERLPQGNDEL